MHNRRRAWHCAPRRAGAAPVPGRRCSLHAGARRNGGSIILNLPDDTTRAALCDLLGRRPAPGASLRFDISDLDAALRHCEAAESLHEALSLLDGPITNRLTQRATAKLAWEQLVASIDDAGLAASLAQPRALGSLKRACHSLASGGAPAWRCPRPG